MENIQWNPIYSVNVKLIDEQHKNLIIFLNRVYESLNKPINDAEFNAFFVDLTNHALAHFATEERYFIEFNYELTKEHIREHDAIKLKIAELNDRFKAEHSTKVMLDVLDFLDSWLIDHLMTHDKKYIKCFNEHGLY